MMVIILPSQSVDGNVNTLHCMKKKDLHPLIFIFLKVSNNGICFAQRKAI